MDARPNLDQRAAGCRVLFAFDIAHGIDLVGAARAVHDPSTSGALVRTHPAPSYFQFTPPPLRVSQHGEALGVGRWRTDEAIEAVLFDFGALLVAYNIALGDSLEECVELSCALAADGSLAQAARRRAQELADSISAHLVKGGLADVFEDYSVFQLPAARLGGAADAFLESNRAQLAGILRAERQPLSREVVADALSVRLQYGPDDLTLVDWHAAVVLDDEPEDVLRVLEYANIQLLEMRFLDLQLDTALEEAFQSMSRRQRHFLRPMGLQRDLRSLSTMQLEAAFLFERLGNTLKVSGDQHLARLLRRAGARFRLEEWNNAAQRKLAALDNVYEKLHDHATALRGEFLEALIVVLILFEIALTLLGH
jgi:hypothetical protein